MNSSYTSLPSSSRHFPKKEGILAFSGGSGFVGTS